MANYPTALSSYLLDLGQLIRDSNWQFTSQAIASRWINKARRQIALRTGCLEYLVTGQSAFGTSSQPGNAIPGAFIPGALPDNQPGNANVAGAAATATGTFATIPGVERYQYSYGNNVLSATEQGVDTISYVNAISPSWGGTRPTLAWMPWEDLQAFCRSYNTGAFSYPAVWSQLGVGDNGSIWIFPAPTQVLEWEWQVQALPSNLYLPSDYEALPTQFHSAVPYYAAYFVYLSSQRFGQANVMLNLFKDQIGVAAIGVDWGHTSDYYWSGRL